MLKCSLPLSLFACLILSGVASSDPIAFSAAIDYENLAARYESMPPEVLSLPSPFMQLRPIAAIKSCETDQSHVQCSVELSTERPLPNCATPCVIARGKFNIQTTATVSNSEALLRNTAEVASIDLADIGSGIPGA